MNRKIVALFDGYWIWIKDKSAIDDGITGKYLFFSENREKLIEIAINEIKNHGFQLAKVNSALLGNQSEYVLCLFYKNNSRKNELADRNKQEYNIKYRYWKNDSDTLNGKYNKDFLGKLSEIDNEYFVSHKKFNFLPV